MAPAIDLVVVSAPDSSASDVSLRDEIGKDPLRRPLRYSDLLSDVASSGLRVTCDAEEHVRVVGEEDPAADRRRFAQRLSILTARFLCHDGIIAKENTRH
jgi:hypothetical protein